MGKFGTKIEKYGLVERCINDLNEGMSLAAIAADLNYALKVMGKDHLPPINRIDVHRYKNKLDRTTEAAALLRGADGVRMIRLRNEDEALKMLKGIRRDLEKLNKDKSLGASEKLATLNTLLKVAKMYDDFASRVERRAQQIYDNIHDILNTEEFKFYEACLMEFLKGHNLRGDFDTYMRFCASENRMVPWLEYESFPKDVLEAEYCVEKEQEKGTEAEAEEIRKEWQRADNDDDGEEA